MLEIWGEEGLDGYQGRVLNEALLWKSAGLGMKNPRVGAGTFCPLPMLVIYIPPCRNCKSTAFHILCSPARSPWSRGIGQDLYS